MVYFYKQYADTFEESLRSAFDLAISHIYMSNFYRKPISDYGHHEAKYTAAKLIFGELFDDQDLLADGLTSLNLTLNRVQSVGMTEYGSLPWFWHWVQAYTAAWELTAIPEIKTTLAQLLDYLWNERSYYYLQGTWAGPHARGLTHDIPRDGNVLLDYVQFGDFTLPTEMPRTEYAGFLFYEAPQAARQRALDRAQPTEVTKLIPRRPHVEGAPLHSYVYITENYAVGGMWERIEEFDNEQQRFDLTFPLNQGDGVNLAYFFHPVNGYQEADPRHQSEFGEVLFHKQVVAALYPLPDSAANTIVGILPKGTWVQEGNALYGTYGSAYLAIYLMQAYELEEKEDRYVVTSEGSSNGVVIEVIGTKEATQRGITNLDQFTATLRSRQPVFSSNESLSVTYATLSDEVISLELPQHSLEQPVKKIQNQPVDFSRYIP
ncbi:hypothetical protein D3C73_780950 [compost metagenome]